MTAPQQTPGPTPPPVPSPGPPRTPPAGAAASGTRPAHFGHALLAEWTKIRSVRSTVWTLGVMAVLVVGIGLLTAWGLSGGTYTGLPLLSPGLFGLMLGQICIITLGVLVISSEYGSGLIRTTFTACPRRGRVLLAKATVFFALAFVMTTVVCTFNAAINVLFLSDQALPGPGTGMPVPEGSVENGRIVADLGEWLGATVGAGLYVALLGLLSLAVGALLRHSAGAITTMLALVLLPLVMAMFMAGEALSGLRDALLEYSPLNGLASLYHIPLSGRHGADGWPLLGILAVATAAVLGLALAVLRRRDV